MKLDKSHICNGKCLGEHLVCSPCGTVTCPHGGVALLAVVWPEVLLSRLPKDGLYPVGQAFVNSTGRVSGLTGCQSSSDWRSFMSAINPPALLLKTEKVPPMR